MTTTNGRKAAQIVLIGVLVVVAGTILALISYNVGYEHDRGTIECKPGLVLAIEVTGADDAGNGRYTLEVGDCSRLDEAAVVAALAALSPAAPATTTTTTTTTTTVPAKTEAESDATTASTEPQT